MLLFYSITNMYISPIQTGIQTAHAVSEMSVKYKEDKSSDYWSWAESGEPVIIVLNGGYASNLQSIYNTIDEYNQSCENTHLTPFNVVKFHESEEAANGLLTSVAVIIDQEEKTKVLAALALNSDIQLCPRDQIIATIGKLRLA